MSAAMAGRQHWDNLRFAADLGSGSTGKTVTLHIQQLSDDQWWNGSAWQAGVATVAMTEVDATNLPGLYEYVMPAGGLDESAAEAGYRFRVSEPTVPFNESGNVHCWTSRLLDERVSDHLGVTGSVGQVLFRTLGTRHGNTRIVHTAWNAQGKPTTGSLYIYTSQADLVADSSPWPLAAAQYDITLTYDGSGQLTEYTSERVS